MGEWLEVAANVNYTTVTGAHPPAHLSRQVDVPAAAYSPKDARGTLRPVLTSYYDLKTVRASLLQVGSLRAVVLLNRGASAAVCCL